MPHPTSRHSAGGPLHVLLVEDDADVADLLRILLGRHGFTVTIAGSVGAALAAAGGSPVDVLVSDIELPDGSGHDLLRRLRENGRLPAIAMSGRYGDADVDDARAAGFDEYVGKPVSIARLVGAIGRVTRG